ncbi:MAG: Hpt domain-containing protein [Syntrophomonadaceae bacterium]|nr:Hpt domain-containing protein [Syntrophomonadaceae bacterium]
MDFELSSALIKCQTDVEGALHRLGGNESLYLKCLADFLADQTMDELNSALQIPLWDEAFTAAHALKGLAGNMGFVPLFHAAAEMVVLIRTGRTSQIAECYSELIHCYNRITAAIRDNYAACVAEAKGE